MPLFFALLVAAGVAAQNVSAGYGPTVDTQMVRLLADADGRAVRTWVVFRDKGIRTDAQYRRAEAEALSRLSPRAVERRGLRRAGPGIVDERDFALSETYVRQVLATGARERARSRWANAISVWATEAQVRSVSRLPSVARVTPVRKSMPLALTDFYSRMYGELKLMDSVRLHARGYVGRGVVVGVLDTGFQRVHQAFFHPDNPLVVLAEHDFINDDGNTGIEPGDPGGQHSHGTLVLSTIGGYYPGQLVGGAYGARFVLAKTEDVSQEVPAEEDYYAAGIEWLEMNGVDMTTSSLGYIDWYSQSDLDGQTAVTTIAVNTATDNGLVCCTAAGNSGNDGSPFTSHLIAPADAFKVLASGAVDDAGNIAGFSSDGPTADGRLKPEVLTQGVSVSCIDPNSTTDYSSASGTSLSTPMLAGAVACMLQARPHWTVEQVRDSIFATASDGSADPLSVRGYGLLDANAAIDHHSISFDFDYPGGRPTEVRTERGTVFVVRVSANGGPDPEHGKAWIHYSLDGGPWVSRKLAPIGQNTYLAALPAAGCGDVVRYFLSARDAANLVASDPPNAIDDTYLAASGTLVFSDTFDTDQGWTIVNESLSSGAWTRVAPLGTNDDGVLAQPDEDSPDTGSLCYATGQGTGGGLGQADVDGGPTRLVSPVLNLAGHDALVSFAAWVYNDDHDDGLVVEVSVDGGGTWTPAMTITHRPVWARYELLLSDAVTPSAQTRIRFSIADQPNNSITECAIDDVRVSFLDCGPLTVTATPR